MDRGTYTPTYGERYFAELVAFVPRPLWPDKPLIGIDYAIARGFSDPHKEHGVVATIATGMVGQGVVNFGPLLGPMVAAALAAAWVSILSRLWTQRERVGRLALYLLGLGLTINLGRDITLLVLFPFVFGYVIVVLHEKWRFAPLSYFAWEQRPA
jgi:hypothetical protein